MCFGEKKNNDKSISFHDAVESFEAGFGRSVEQHLLSDVPVASIFRLDSTLLQFLQPALKFTRKVSQEVANGIYRKVRYRRWMVRRDKPASLLTSKLNSEHRKTLIKPHDLIRSLDDVIDALDEPRWGWEPFLSTWLLSIWDFKSS